MYRKGGRVWNRAWVWNVDLPLSSCVAAGRLTKPLRYSLLCGNDTPLTRWP